MIEVLRSNKELPDYFVGANVDLLLDIIMAAADQKLRDSCILPHHYAIVDALEMIKANKHVVENNLFPAIIHHQPTARSMLIRNMDDERLSFDEAVSIIMDPRISIKPHGLHARLSLSHAMALDSRSKRDDLLTKAQSSYMECGSRFRFFSEAIDGFKSLEKLQIKIEDKLAFSHQVVGLSLYDTIDLCVRLSYTPPSKAKKSWSTDMLKIANTLTSEFDFSMRSRTIIDINAAIEYDDDDQLSTIFISNMQDLLQRHKQFPFKLTLDGSRPLPGPLPALDNCIKNKKPELALKFIRSLPTIDLRVHYLMKMELWELAKSDIMVSTKDEKTHRIEFLEFLAFYCTDAQFKKSLSKFSAEEAKKVESIGDLAGKIVRGEDVDLQDVVHGALGKIGDLFRKGIKHESLKPSDKSGPVYVDDDGMSELPGEQDYDDEFADVDYDNVSDYNDDGDRR